LKLRLHGNRISAKASHFRISDRSSDGAQATQYVGEKTMRIDVERAGPESSNRSRTKYSGNGAR